MLAVKWETKPSVCWLRTCLQEIGHDDRGSKSLEVKQKSFSAKSGGYKTQGLIRKSLATD